ncbi:uncharacterized protein FIESC28_02307 [Fusarium coffeatum]|uniref:Xylanolytic transcriptional activator regulatory domain-containing protein n=1 Tax=Fusarium coffeatum TaxID=231269 RepID=A0A366S6G9_9HYPO|nr:uncharacterized protein FIESC28_02307 [Fusarium coffeatum]RBR24889.1 hypothetical protein FIESC28_02307 [Fusarium coffeatum]
MELETQLHDTENASIEASPATSNLTSSEESTQTFTTGSGEGQSSFIGSSSGIHLVRSALECAQQDYSNLETPSESAEARPNPPQPQKYNERTALPPRELANNLKDTFFSCYQIQYPILNQEQFEKTMSQFYDDHEGRNDTSDLSAVDVRVRFMINMVLAIPLMSMAGDHDESHTLSKSLTANAMVDAGHIMQAKNVQSLQCLLLLLLLSIVDSSSAPVWYISGLCMRMCIDLGYHSERTIDMSSFSGATDTRKEEEADIKRRLFWIARSFDRTFAVLLGRPFTFDNLPVDVDLPGCSLTSTNRQQTLHWLELQRLQSVIVHRLHGTRDAIDRHHTEDSELEISQWMINMAESLRDWNNIAQTLADPCGCDVNWWSYWHRTALLILYRPSSLRPSLSPSETLSCYMAAKELIQLSFLRISEGLADFTWIDLHFQFMSGITMILIIWKNVEARNKAQEDWVSLKSTLFQWKLILERLGARWERIGRAREVLSRLADATVDLVEKDPARPTGALQTRVFQGRRETRRSQRHSIIQRLRNLSQQDRSSAGSCRDSRLPDSNTASDGNTIQLSNSINNRNPEHRGQDVTTTQELPLGPAGWNWTDSNVNIQQETAIGSQAVGNTSNWEAEETLWPLLNLSDITTGTDELDLWAYFSAPMLDMENLALPNFNGGIRLDESLNNSILNFQGDLDYLPSPTGANGTEGSH